MQVNGRRPVEKLEPRRLFSASSLPRYDHVVVLIEEDHSYNDILGPPGLRPEIWPSGLPPIQGQAPYLYGLAASGASFTHAYSVGNHNALDYQSIFSGLTPAPNDHGSTTYSAPNLASELNAAGLSFGGYAESLPRVGYTGYSAGDYTRAHNPWVNLTNVPASENLPFSKFPGNYARLPTVSFVVPNEQNNMHSGTVQQGDQWAQQNIKRYADWTTRHNSLLIVTWDESHVSNDQIPTIFYGAGVTRGLSGQKISQLNILRTLEDMYGLAPTGNAAKAAPITGIFKTSGLSHQVARKTTEARRHGGALPDRPSPQAPNHRL